MEVINNEEISDATLEELTNGRGKLTAAELLDKAKRALKKSAHRESGGTVSDLSSYTRISPNTSGIRLANISKVTVHHMAGNCSIETCGEIFANPDRQASSNYGIGSDGRIGCYLTEEYHPWTSSSYWNDERAITLEVADYDLDEWSPSSAAYESTVKLCADICDRYGIEPYYDGTPDATFTEHMMFASTGCPGPWWHARMSQFVEDVKAAMEDDFMSIDELMNTQIATADSGNIPLWQAWSWAYTYAMRADKKCAELEERVKQIEAGNVDYQELAKAVNDDAAKRMAQ